MDLRYALRQLRNELDMNQSELASILHVSNITVNRWETGKNPPNRATSMLILMAAKEKGVSKVCLATLQEALFPTLKETGLDDAKYAEIDQINQLLNDSANAVVVCDVETHEILYMNHQLANITNQTVEQAEGKKCYEYMLHRDAPCENCEIVHASKNTYTDFSYFSPRTGRHYTMRGKVITWKGRTAYIEYITDTTELYRMKVEVEERQQILLDACRFANLWTFKYDIKKNSVETGKRVQEEFGFPKFIENFPENLPDQSIISPDTRESFLELMSNVRNGVEQSEAKIQARFADGTKHWLRLRMDIIRYDEAGKPEVAACLAQLIDGEL